MLSNCAFIPSSTPVFAHPLLKNLKLKKEVNEETIASISNETETTTSKENLFLDPLGAASSTVVLENGLGQGCNGVPTQQKASDDACIGLDEVTSRLLDNTLKAESEDQVLDLDPHLIGFRPWRELRQEVLEKFTTSDHLTLESSFLSSKGQNFQEKKRLLNGNSWQTVIKFYDLTQEVYLKKLSDLKKVLLLKWKQEKRIECIKLVTELARSLSTASTSQFYPAQYVHITDILDFFSSLVYDRLLKRARQERVNAKLPPLTANFLIHDVLEQTRITARNWFGKVAEIKELIPRIYIECALLRCMNFMDQSSMGSNVMRLCTLAKSVQHPLISSYVRCYICRISMRLNAADRAPAWKCLNDWMQTYSQQPTALLWPAMQYIIQCVSYSAVSYNDLSPLWEYCRLPEKRPIILSSMLSAVSYIYLAEHALEASRIVTGSDQVTGDELCALGTNLLKAEVSESVRKPLLKSVWKCVVRLASLKDYIHCCEVWIEFVAKYFTINELQIILESIIRKLLPDKKYELYYLSLVSILRKVLSHIDDISAILNMEIFPQFIDLFREESFRMQSSSLILNALVSRHSFGNFSDINLAHQVLGVCRRLNESTSVFSSEEEIDRVSSLIQSSIDRFNLNVDPEQTLTFYVACRAALLNNDKLQKFTILKILALALYVVRSVKFSTSRSTFIQACIANLFITIPSLRDPIQRLHLSIQSANIALASLTFLQVDSFVNFCLETFAQLPSSSFQQFQTTGTYFLSLLVQVPCMDGQHLLHNFTTFLQTIKDFQWPAGGHPTKGYLLLDCLQYVFVVAGISNKTDTFSLAQFQWANSADDHPSLQQHCYEVVDELVGMLQPCLQEESTDRLNTCMKFAEIVSLFSNQQLLSEQAQSLVKDCFKRCKRSSLMATRIKRLKMDANS